MNMLLLVSLLCFVSCSAEDKGVLQVHRLTDADFDDTVKDGFWLMEFFAVCVCILCWT